MTTDANDLEVMAKEHPNECFLKGSGVLKLIGAIRMLEAEVAALKAQPAPTEAAQGWDVDDLISDMGIAKEATAARAELRADPTIIASILAAQGEDSTRLAHDCIESIASGHGYMDNYESFHCACCGADLDDKEDHSDDCLTIRAQKFLARASAETGGVKS